jgi:DNA invertase Pin-like site-specific DNA recombinase
MTVLIGYVRVSTHEQNEALQLDALAKAGVDPDYLYIDKVSGAKDARPQLDIMRKTLRKGDVLVIWKLDRLGRSVLHLAEWLKFLIDKEIGFRSVTEGIDTNTLSGRLLYHILSGVAEFERGLIVERTKAGMAAAKARGRMGGRKKSITAEKLEMAVELLADKTRTVPAVAKQLGVGPSTLYRDMRLYWRDREQNEANGQQEMAPVAEMGQEAA